MPHVRGWPRPLMGKERDQQSNWISQSYNNNSLAERRTVNPADLKEWSGGAGERGPVIWCLAFG